MFWLIVHFILYGTGGFQDETLSGYSDRTTTYHLVEMNGAPVQLTASISFSKARRMSARSPCFAYHAQITVPLPWFELVLTEDVAYSCIETPFEEQFRDALVLASFAEVSGGVIILRDLEGREMVFRAAQ